VFGSPLPIPGAAPAAHVPMCGTLGRLLTPDYASVFMFLLPGGRPRRGFLVVSCFSLAIQAGGRPRRLAPPAARRSSARIACSSFWCSPRNSASIRVTSIFLSMWQPRLACRSGQRLAPPLLLNRRDAHLFDVNEEERPVPGGGIPAASQGLRAEPKPRGASRVHARGRRLSPAVGSC
jgi:hypothetical protein